MGAVMAMECDGCRGILTRDGHVVTVPPTRETLLLRNAERAGWAQEKYQSSADGYKPWYCPECWRTIHDCISPLLVPKGAARP